MLLVILSLHHSNSSSILIHRAPSKTPTSLKINSFIFLSLHHLPFLVPPSYNLFLADPFVTLIPFFVPLPLLLPPGAPPLCLFSDCQFDISGWDGIIRSSQVEEQERVKPGDALDCIWTIRAPPQSKVSDIHPSNRFNQPCEADVHTVIALMLKP